VWVKTRTVDHHPISGIDPVNCTPQLGRPGRWSDRLPHFRMGRTPSSGEELQSEYLVRRPFAVEAIEAVRALAGTVAPILQVTEIRTAPADRLWMSPQRGRETIGIHFTWAPDPEAVVDALARVEAALAPMQARPPRASSSWPAPPPSRRSASACRTSRARRSPRPAWGVPQPVAEAHLLGG
jgi:xylitol oxidase